MPVIDEAEVIDAVTNYFENTRAGVPRAVALDQLAADLRAECERWCGPVLEPDTDDYCATDGEPLY